MSGVGEVFAEYVYDQHSLTIGSKYCLSRSHAATQLEHHGIVKQTVVQGVFKVSLAMACKSHSGNLNHWQKGFFSVRIYQKGEAAKIVAVRSSSGFLFFL